MPNRFTFPIRVYIEDTDAGGIVYHANHIKFMERARTEWLRSLGLEHYLLEKIVLFVVHHIDIKYLKPARINDLLNVIVLPLRCQGASFIVQQQIHVGDRLIATANITIACVSSELKTVLIPDHLRELLLQHIPQS